MFNIFDLGELLSFGGNYSLKKKINKLFKIKPLKKNFSSINKKEFYTEIDKVNNKNELKLLLSEINNNRILLFDGELKRKRINYILNINKKLKKKRKLGLEYESKIIENFDKMFKASIVKLENENEIRYFKGMRPDIIYKNINNYGIIEIKYKSKFENKISLTNLTQLVIYMLFYNKKISEGYLMECFSEDKLYITYISMDFAIKFYNKYIKDKIKKLAILYNKLYN